MGIKNFPFSFFLAVILIYNCSSLGQELSFRELTEALRMFWGKIFEMQKIIQVDQLQNHDFLPFRAHKIQTVVLCSESLGKALKVSTFFPKKIWEKLCA